MSLGARWFLAYSLRKNCTAVTLWGTTFLSSDASCDKGIEQLKTKNEDRGKKKKEKKKKREREGQREKDRQRETERERDRDTERETDRERESKEQKKRRNIRQRRRGRRRRRTRRTGTLCMLFSEYEFKDSAFSENSANGLETVTTHIRDTRFS